MNEQATLPSPAQDAPAVEDWRQALPEELTAPARGEDGIEREVSLRAHPALAKYASKDEAVKALVHAQRLLGRRPDLSGYVRVPADDAADEDWAAFHAASGRPEEPAGYEFPEPPLPKGVALNQELFEGFRARAHEMGLSSRQAKGLFEWFVPLTVEALQSRQDEAAKAKESELASLRTVHGGKTQQVLDDAKRAALTLGGEELLHSLDATGAGDRASVIQAFARIAPLVLEDRMRGRDSEPVGRLTPARLREMMRDPRYYDPSRRDRAYVETVQKGFETLYPGEYAPPHKP